jgi:outer membrane receptor protein involved in Fe transport
MPRISFSFPISDEALFYAHYDMLTQRPTSNAYCSPLVYLRFNEYGETVDNPNLKPSQTIDYELGFKQKLTNTSSLTITAYYRELRNMIQMYRYNGAYPKAYNGYSNLDFGTVKGLTASYDLRRTKNARVRASYTLQFDNKTGASATTASALIAAGVPNLRSTYPSNSDRRHSFNLTLDYRFKRGKEYNGPVIKREKSGKSPVQLLANTGFALTVNGGSGAPYTAARKVLSPIQQGTSLLQGTYNGSRMPASFRFDLRVDKDINFTAGAKEGKKGHDFFINVYLQILNLLNSKNIMNVYSATGNPNDDGYLSAPEWQREINEQLDPQAFRQMYELYVNSGGNYSTPRQIRLGLSFNF